MRIFFRFYFKFVKTDIRKIQYEKRFSNYDICYFSSNERRIFRLKDFYGEKILLYLGFFLAIGNFYPGDWEFFIILGFLSRGLGIFIPGIWDFYPRGSGIFENLGIFIPEIGDFLKSGDLY